MSNSSLVSYTRISPHKYSPRDHAIDTITIHCMAGNLSLQTCGQIFQTRQASSNYGIDSAGQIALYVDESDGSWCSSSPTVSDSALCRYLPSQRDRPSTLGGQSCPDRPDEPPEHDRPPLVFQ